MSTSEHVTILFTDLVGSTELASALAPEAADEVRRAHFSSLRQAIAATDGTEVKNLGDGLMVVFPAASAALQCAVAMQQAVDRANVGADRALGLRVGLSAGEATREGEDYFGDPVVEASRLCARADGGQILASDLARAAAGRRSSHTFAPLGELELKGLPDPIETFEVAWEPLGEAATRRSGAIPLPVRLSHRPTVGVIGRSGELDTLEAAAKRAATGAGREVVLIGGEPGQGKTTLVGELARHLEERDTTVLLGRCDEEVGAPYRPFQEALTHYVAHADEELLRAHVAANGGELSRLVPALRQRLGEVPAPQATDPDTERYLLFAAVVGLLELAATDRPVALVLDDLHWADKPTLQLLRHVVAETGSAHLVVIGTYRDAELSSAHPLTETLSVLLREPAGVTSLSLHGFDDTGVIAFMESAAGHDLDDDGVELAHDLYRETDGNPFFVSEVLRNLSESGAIYQDDTGRWRADSSDGHLALPHSVRAVIGTRVSRLGEEATKVLSAASVIGREFDLDVLAETTGVDEDTLIDLLEQAQRAAVVTELEGTAGRFTFAHALIQHTLYEDMGTSRRTRLHRVVGEALERLYGEGSDERVGELARHFLMATRPADADKAIGYARRAGDAALVALAPDDAVHYFTQAYELASQTPTVTAGARIDLLISLGIAQRQTGMPEFRTTLLDAAQLARREGDAQRLAVAAVENTRGWFSSLGVVDAERVEVLEAALELLPDADSAERSRLLATLCSELTYSAPLERRLELYEQAKGMARRLGDMAALIDTVVRCNTSTRSASTVRGQVGDLLETVDAAKVIDDPARLVRALVVGYPVFAGTGHFDQCAGIIATARALVDKIRQPALLWNATFNEASDALLHGDPTRAEELATTALEIGTASSQPDAVAYFGAIFIAVRRQQGRSGELVPMITDVAERNPGVPAFTASLATAYADSGNHAAARDLFDAFAAGEFWQPEDQAWLTGMVMYANVAVQLQLEDGAARLFEILAPCHDLIPHNGLSASEPVALYLGGLATVLGRFAEAETHFAESADLASRGAMRYSEARTNWWWGRMLLRRGDDGDVDRARPLLQQAVALGAAQGYARVERMASEDLSAIA